MRRPAVDNQRSACLRDILRAPLVAAVDRRPSVLLEVLLADESPIDDVGLRAEEVVHHVAPTPPVAVTTTVGLDVLQIDDDGDHGACGPGGPR